MKDKAETFLKKILGRNSRGPNAVFESLALGLRGLGEEFCVNCKPESQAEVACVLSGVRTLAWAIEQKKKRVFKKLVAGPNIVVNPNEEGGLLKNSLIDIIIAPSQWVKDYYSAVAPEIAGKIQIWPAGVVVPPLPRAKEKQTDFLVYNKIGDNILLEYGLEYLKNKGFSYKVFTYGRFKQQDYYAWLEKTKYEIYLSNSESQGLAMFEAWARGVPTLVWEKGFYKSEGVRISGKISAPFLEKASGLFFSNENDFASRFDEFLNIKYEPREYVKANFTNKITAQNYLYICYGKKGN